MPSGSDALPGIDRKADGGYVVAPPSLHASGRRYRFAADWPEDMPLAPLPAFALNGSKRGASVATAAPGGRIAAGSRNGTLTSLAGAMRRRGASRDTIAAALLTENGERCDPPLSESDVSRIAASVSRYEPAEGPDAPGPFPRTDSGNAELFAHVYGDEVRFDHRRRRWLRWAAHWWESDADGAVQRLAREAARSRYTWAATIEDLEERKREAGWAIQSESRQKLDAALSLAESLRPIADAGTRWDADPWALAVLNGVVNLRIGELRTGRPADGITQHVPIIYDPDAECPRWEAFLEEVFDGDPEIIDFIHRAVGYSLTGDTSEQVLFLCHGSGANGKSVFLAVLRQIGGAASYNMPWATIELTNRAAIPNDVADLDGRRLVTASETAEGARLNEARLKALTGGDPITARHLFGEFFTFEPVAKFWLAANHRPRVDDLSYAFWRRVRLLPFLRQFREDADKALLDKLRAETPGILAWAVRGCLEWQRLGLEPPVKVRAATDEYRRESDPLGDFLAERCEIAPDAVTTAAELYAGYQAWAQSQRLRDRETLTRTKFGRRLSDAFTKGRDGPGRVTYAGLSLKDSEGLAPDSVSGRRVDPLFRIPPLEKPLSRIYEENPSNPSNPSTIDPDTFTCLRCGGDDLAYDGDTGEPYCPVCRCELAGATP